MKKFFALAAAALMTVGAAHAQDWSVGGNLGFWRNITDNTSKISVTPELNYSLDDHWTLGAKVGYQYYFHNGAHNNSFVIDPYSRYTLYKTGPVKILCDGGIDISLGQTRWKNGHSDTSCALGIGLKPGVQIDVTKQFSLVAHFGFLGYQYANHAAEMAGYKQAFGFDFSNGVDFGFYYNF